MNLFQMSRDERVAFFINIYNALVVHAMAMFGPAESTLKRCARNISNIDVSRSQLTVPGPCPT